jgi:outer membrane receptor for Fe3+-dicitrate
MTGDALPGVTVSDKAISVGTQTDVDGKYSLSVPKNSTLVFSYTGYAKQEVFIVDQTIVNISLSSESSELDEVVVVGYGSQRKIDVTGSVAVVKGEDISKQASTNALSALQGKVAGVQITNSGSPGSSPQVRIRGLRIWECQSFVCCGRSLA